jgi:hypothetical protein
MQQESSEEHEEEQQPILTVKDLYKLQKQVTYYREKNKQKTLV